MHNPSPSAGQAALSRGSRQRGAWFGLAVGDALGAAYEFKRPEAIAAAAPGRLVMRESALWELGEWTDDTDLTLAASEAYLGDGFDLSYAVDAMLAWLRKAPKDVGNLTRKALCAIARGDVKPTEAGAWALVGNHHAAGNGSLMRASPTGLRRTADDPRLDRESAALSRITHADPRCVEACIAYNVILACLVESLDVSVALSAARRRVANREVLAVLDRCLDGAQPVHTNQHGFGFVLLSLEWSLVALRDSPSYEVGIDTIVRRGGDTDTNAAIAGALLGARFGKGAIPSDWLADLRAPRCLGAALRQLLGE